MMIMAMAIMTNVMIIITTLIINDFDDDDHISSVFAHALFLEHEQGLQSSSHEGV